MSLQELMEVNITTVPKRDEKLSDFAATAYVTTSEDVERSGFTTIEEAFRMPPGVEIPRIDANKSAISKKFQRSFH